MVCKYIFGISLAVAEAVSDIVFLLQRAKTVLHIVRLN